MGIKGLMPFLKKRCPNVFRSINLSELHNKRIAIDAPLYLYRFMYCGSREIAFQRFRNQIQAFREAGVSVCYVFDGKPLPCKVEEQKSRREAQRKYEKTTKEQIEYHHSKIASLLSPPEQPATPEQPKKPLTPTQFLAKLHSSHHQIQRLENRIVRVEKRDLIALQHMFFSEGVTHCIAENEGELTATQLVKDGICHYVLTEDTDVLAAGAPAWLRNYNPIDQTFELVLLDKVLHSIGMSKEEFTEFCVLIGCDFSARIPRVGPVRACGFIKRYSSIEALLKSPDRAVLRLPEQFNPEQALAIFRQTHVAFWPALSLLFIALIN